MTIKHITKEELTTPKDGYQVITNSWWWIKDGLILDWENGNGVRIPQTNKDKRVMEYMNDKFIYAGYSALFLPVAFYPQNV